MPLLSGEERTLVYADWIASGRLYRPIEDFMTQTIAPLVANTHTETTYTGASMTNAYHQAREIIKGHVNAGKEDSLFLAGFGMTAVVNKLQRMLGLRQGEFRDKEKPVVLVTHMEHHSNQITWEECDARVIIVPRGEDGLPDLDQLRKLAEKHKKAPMLIGAFTACSNVTGIITPYHKMARIIHEKGGICFVDFAASAPYVNIDMHPEDPLESLEGILFSPHKFLGGPGTSGVLVLSNRLYKRLVPDTPGGGTVKWTTPFGTHAYFEDIEIREDGGTPGFLQAIRIALAIRLKEAMGVDNILAREEELKEILREELTVEPALFLLEEQVEHRIGAFSLYATGIHHNLMVRLLNDRFGIQTRGGCSCAGTYGHILFNIDRSKSHNITDMIDHGDLTEKPGWVRVSLHPTMTNEEVRYIGQALVEVARKGQEWADDYHFQPQSGDYLPKKPEHIPKDLLTSFEPV